jgi:Bacterial dnaA protein helix-turn-helix
MAEIINEKQIAGFQTPAVPALPGQLPVVPGQIKVRRVLKVTAAHYGMTVDELLARRRTQLLLRRQHVAMYVAYDVTGRGTPFIAYYMGNRHHQTVMHGVRAVKSLLDADDVATAAAVRQITERLQMTAGRGAAERISTEPVAVPCRTAADVRAQAAHVRAFRAQVFEPRVVCRQVFEPHPSEPQPPAPSASVLPAIAEQPSTTPGPILVRRVLRVTAEHYGTTPDDLVSVCRTKPLVRHRQVAMYVAHKTTGCSTPFIASHMGDRHHTTILHGVRAVQSLLDAGDVATTAAVRQITERLQMTAGRM